MILCPAGETERTEPLCCSDAAMSGRSMKRRDSIAEVARATLAGGA